MTDKTRQDVLEHTKAAITKMLEDGSLIDHMARVAVMRQLDQQLAERNLTDVAERIISAGWHRERARLFLAGAEWARARFPDIEPPAGFYHAMEARADAVARGVV